MSKLIACLLVILGLTACAVRYTFDGQAYTTAQEFSSAVDAAYSRAVNAIQPLPRPVTDKTLVVASFSEQTIVRESIAAFSRVNGRPIGLGEEIVQRNVWNSTYKGIKVFYDVVQRKNIYPNVRYVELDSFAGTLEPSATEDVLYPNVIGGAAQWYYVSKKSGKQAFAYDRARPTLTDRLQSFADSVAVYAVRN